MVDKIRIDGIDYDLDQLSDQSKTIILHTKDLETRILEKENLKAVLTKAKMSYMSDLKSEMLSHKAGFNFSD